MLVLGIIFLVLLSLALLRFGFIVEYGELGVSMWAKVGFLKFSLSGDDKEKKPKKKKKKKDKDKASSLKMPGSLSGFLEILKVLKNALGRFKRRLLIKELTVYYSSAGEDAAKVAMTYGSVNAVLGFIVPVFDRHFRIKKRDLRAFVDFESDSPKIYAKARVSIAVWEVFYVLFALFPLLKTLSSGKARGETSGDKSSSDELLNDKSSNNEPSSGEPSSIAVDSRN